MMVTDNDGSDGDGVSDGDGDLIMMVMCEQ